ncbi:gamma-glutamylcyclotransferase family protein [Actinomadura miaoliensis]|uniref:gamma-glutamylcyclotransferase family protein n=1 Tax=Actinomadura miaoliensis TaxID=430685 RepID=UPI0031F10CA0
MEGLFVYGTLRFPEILRVLLGRVPDMRPATATGWSVRALPGVVYPGLVADPDGVAQGLVMTGLTEAERRLLDAYEDDDYDPVLITLDDGQRAWTYVWKASTEPYDWDVERFAREELPAFVDRCRLWRRAFTS